MRRFIYDREEAAQFSRTNKKSTEPEEGKKEKAAGQKTQPLTKYIIYLRDRRCDRPTAYLVNMIVAHFS